MQHDWSCPAAHGANEEHCDCKKVDKLDERGKRIKALEDELAEANAKLTAAENREGNLDRYRAYWNIAGSLGDGNFVKAVERIHVLEQEKKAMEVEAQTLGETIDELLKSNESHHARLVEAVFGYEEDITLADTLEVIRMMREKLKAQEDAPPPADAELLALANRTLGDDLAKARREIERLQHGWKTATEQATTCARCLVFKHTPWRDDDDGYICAGCMGKENDQLKSEVERLKDVIRHLRPVLDAKDAYERYANTVDWKNFRGEQMPQFADLTEVIKEAWMSAIHGLVPAKAVRIETQATKKGFVLIVTDPRGDEQKTAQEIAGYLALLYTVADQQAAMAVYKDVADAAIAFYAYDLWKGYDAAHELHVKAGLSEAAEAYAKRMGIEVKPYDPTEGIR